MFQALESFEENSDDEYDFSMDNQVTRMFEIDGSLSGLKPFLRCPNRRSKKITYKEDRSNSHGLYTAP
jgi:hypothetical protein